MTGSTIRDSSNHERPQWTPVILGLIVSILSGIAAAAVWKARHDAALTLMISGMGLSMGPLLVLHGAVSRRWKSLARKLILLGGGGTGLVFSLWTSTDLHLEGFFLLLLSGVMGAAIIHVLITVILGPFVFGRILCGWGCWNAMVLDLLPFRKKKNRPVRGGFSNFVLLASFLFIVLVRFAFGHRAPSPGTPSAFLWTLGGFVFYYVLAVGTAFAFRDNRAFCKYICPSSAILRQVSRFSLLKITGNPERCNGCGLCAGACPMDLNVSAYIKSGQRVTSGECIQCRSCVNACPSRALKWSVALDGGRRDNDQRISGA
jgi:ferredoxin-type protein NapH